MDTAQFRDYLLGRLDESGRKEFESLRLPDKTYPENLSILEEELIEEYLDGSLSTDDLADFENNFLSVPENAEKVREFELLISHRQWERSNLKSTYHGKMGRIWSRIQGSITFCGLIATTSIILSVGYGLFLHTKLKHLDDQIGIVKEEQKILLRQVREFRQKLKENEGEGDFRPEQQLYRSQMPLGMLTGRNSKIEEIR